MDGWLAPWLPAKRSKSAVRVAALVETDEALKGAKDEREDPKLLLRALLGGRGVTTQFISATSAPKRKGKTDHPAEQAVGDLFRSTGFFLRPFPAVGVTAGTLLVGIYCSRATGKKLERGRAGLLVNVVACVAGETNAYGWDGKTWASLHAASAAYVASDAAHDKAPAKASVEHAIAALRVRFKGTPIVLHFDAYGCRRLWPCLQDKSDGVPEPWMTADEAAVVRVRSVMGEVPRMAGPGPWTKEFRPGRFTAFKVLHDESALETRASYVVSGSAVMGQMRSARHQSRFAAGPEDLRDPWHSLATTEILVMNSGAFAEDDVVRESALLCRASPFWERNLRWPAPLHLARAVVRDYPHRAVEDERDESGEPVDDGPPRFDHW